MDLGCIDMGCLEKRTKETPLDSETKSTKNKATREASQPSVGALNKFTSQIKKPPHRKGSPINWFPRNKVDSYLKRKIKLLQEVGGMNSTLDETLGDANPHYSKVLKEKMAVREAADKAMETRKAAMVEASWCRILQAARIHNKDAEALLLEAEKTASEAYEAAKVIGVIMYDVPDCPQKQYEIETSIVNGGRLSTHPVTAAFETAFEVDKQVAAAVKIAFIKLASCPSINKEEFREIVQKISENPGGEDFLDVCEISSEYESDTGSELGSGLNCETLITESKPEKNKKKQVLEKLNMAKLVDLMLERLRHLQEDELASLATIVATCGLSAALAEAENDKQPGSRSFTDHHHNHPKRVSSIGVMRIKKVEPELPSLDKFLVKRLTRLEKEVQDAKDARIKENLENINGITKEKGSSSTESDSDLGSVLVKKHSSKLEREIEEAKRTGINAYEMQRGVTEEVIDVPLDKFLVKHLSKLEREVQEAKNKINIGHGVDDVASATQTQVCCDGKPMDKENIDLNKNENKVIETRSLDEILVKPVHRLEKEKLQALSLENEYVSKHYQNRRKDASVEEWESLDRLLVKHVSRLEKEKIEMGSQEPLVKVKRNELGDQGSLDQILVKHKSRLEKEQMAFFAEKLDVEANKPVMMTRRDMREKELQEAWEGLSLGNSMGSQEPLEKVKRLEMEKVPLFAEKSDNEAKHVMTRREMRERELQEAWGGLSLGNSIRPHLSRLQRDKAAWLKAEEEEKRKHVEEKIV